MFVSLLVLRNFLFVLFNDCKKKGSFRLKGFLLFKVNAKLSALKVDETAISASINRYIRWICHQRHIDFGIHTTQPKSLIRYTLHEIVKCKYFRFKRTFSRFLNVPLQRNFLLRIGNFNRFSSFIMFLLFVSFAFVWQNGSQAFQNTWHFNRLWSVNFKQKSTPLEMKLASHSHEVRMKLIRMSIFSYSLLIINYRHFISTD